jgi:hypothetical protein
MSAELLKEQEAKIEQLNNEISAMKAAAEAEKLAGAVSEAAAASQHKPAAVPNSALQDVQRERVIKAVGGRAHYASLPMEVRLKSNGQQPATAEEIELSRTLFGRNSSSIEATRLYKSNAARYVRLQTIFREL